MVQNPFSVQLPVRGEWLCPNTPGTRVPSHGTNMLGTRYAYDFIQVDWTRLGRPAYRRSVIRRILSGVSLQDYYCWGQEVHSPCDGVVIAAEDGWPENAKTNLRTDLSRAHNIARHFDPGKDDIRSVAGNYVIIRASEHVYAALCHLQTDSVDVSVGQHLTQGDVLGRVGHSGNSLGPHLHFQLMDSYNMAEAKGIPCAFTEYEIFQDGRWNKVHDGIPTSRDRIRF